MSSDWEGRLSLRNYPTHTHLFVYLDDFVHESLQPRPKGSLPSGNTAEGGEGGATGTTTCSIVM